jgi:toxin ParE1/3/4
MKYRVVLKNQAERDLRQVATDLLAYRGQDRAIQFLEAAEKSFDRLAQMPEIGKKCQMKHRRLADLRQWRVKAFEDYLIFIPHHDSAGRSFAGRSWGQGFAKYL